MNVASLELCKELYELSKWFDTGYKHYEINGKYEILPSIKITDDWGDEGRNVLSMLAPAYDLGYLLRKLEPLTEERGRLFVTTRNVGDWTAGFSATYDAFHDDKGIADTPEGAVCSLAISLFKAGVLKHE
jgi:hypothetical protein